VETNDLTNFPKVSKPLANWPADTGRARHSVRAGADMADDGAHGVTRPTLSPAGMVLNNLVRIFGQKNVFIEIQRHRLREQRRVRLPCSFVVIDPAQPRVDKNGWSALQIGPAMPVAWDRRRCKRVDRLPLQERVGQRIPVPCRGGIRCRRSRRARRGGSIA